MSLDINRIQAICFDLDGTLRDTDDLFVWNLQQVFHPLSFIFPNLYLQTFSRRLVMTLEDSMTWLSQLHEWGQLENLTEYLARVFARSSEREKPGPNPIIGGVESMLRSLASKYPLAIVSARREPFVMSFVDEHRLRGYFQAIVTRQTCRLTKPSPEPVLFACAQMHVAPENCLMIGDTKVDILSGKNAGAQTCGVLCGFGKEEELVNAGADVILASTPDILQLLGDASS